MLKWMHHAFLSGPTPVQAHCHGAGGKENQQHLSASEVRLHLKDHIKGHWRLKVICSRGSARTDPCHTSSSTKKCGCPYALVAEHAPGSDYVLVTEVGTKRLMLVAVFAVIPAHVTGAPVSEWGATYLDTSHARSAGGIAPWPRPQLPREPAIVKSRCTARSRGEV